LSGLEDVDARDKRGHDDSTQADVLTLALAFALPAPQTYFTRASMRLRHVL